MQTNWYFIYVLGVRMLDGIVNDAIEARGLSLNPSHIGKTYYFISYELFETRTIISQRQDVVVSVY